MQFCVLTEHLHSTEYYRLMKLQSLSFIVPTDISITFLIVDSCIHISIFIFFLHCQNICAKREGDNF